MVCMHIVSVVGDGVRAFPSFSCLWWLALVSSCGKWKVLEPSAAFGVWCLVFAVVRVVLSLPPLGSPSRPFLTHVPPCILCASLSLSSLSLSLSLSPSPFLSLSLAFCSSIDFLFSATMPPISFAPHLAIVARRVVAPHFSFWSTQPVAPVV